METTPIFLIALGRSGTHLISGILANGPEVENRSEVLNADLRKTMAHNYFNFYVDRIGEDPTLAVPNAETQEMLFDAYLASLSESAAKPFQLISVQYNQAHHFNGGWYFPDDTPYLIRMIKSREYPVIHLVRRNFLARYCSLQLAYKTGHWVEYGGTVSPEPPVQLTLDVGRLHRELVKTQMRVNFFDWCLQGHQRLTHVAYEDILEDGVLNRQVYGNLCNLLRQDLAIKREPSTKKIAPPLKRLIANYDEVAKSLQGTPFAGFAL